MAYICSGFGANLQSNEVVWRGLLSLPSALTVLGRAFALLSSTFQVHHDPKEYLRTSGLGLETLFSVWS